MRRQRDTGRFQQETTRAFRNENRNLFTSQSGSLHFFGVSRPSSVQPSQPLRRSRPVALLRRIESRDGGDLPAGRQGVRAFLVGNDPSLGKLKLEFVGMPGISSPHLCIGVGTSPVFTFTPLEIYQSDCWESNPDLTHPKRVYCHYTTVRYISNGASPKRAYCRYTTSR